MDGKPKWSVYAIAAAFVVVLVAPGSFLLASNIGWKVNLPLVNGFVAPGPKGDNWIGVAPVSPYTTYTQLCNTFAAAGATKANISLAQINPSTGVITSVNCLVGSGAAFTPGRAIRVRITGAVPPASPTNIVLVGASGNQGGSILRPAPEGTIEPDNHAGIPTIIGGFVAPGPAKDNWLYPPITTIWTKASNVCGYLGMGLGQGNVSWINPTNGVTTTFTCGLTVNNFNLPIGLGIRIRKVTAGDIDPNSVERPLEWPVY